MAKPALIHVSVIQRRPHYLHILALLAQRLSSLPRLGTLTINSKTCSLTPFPSFAPQQILEAGSITEVRAAQGTLSNCLVTLEAEIQSRQRSAAELREQVTKHVSALAFGVWQDVSACYRFALLVLQGLILVRCQIRI
jgi:hypothetical protein